MYTETPQIAHKPESRKVRYTKAALRDAFIELLRRKPADKITVTEICRAADVSRGTFYLHFKDPRDLMEHIEDGAFAALAASMRARVEKVCEGDSQAWAEILTEIYAHRDLAPILFSDPSSTFVCKCLALNRSYSGVFCEGKYPGRSDAEMDYIYTFHEAGSASVVAAWVRGGFKEPIPQIAALLAELNG
ncbi:MAG: TetR/AcrR family transcriptional regulator [Clostridiales Family XIII bacterium]|jgi:AcrR family transcriptional regulator|nr:TetR/AcrR family transcriptional regulator [Clostridiales Family XIII bacterium]